MFYLMDEQGNFVDYFGKSLSVEAIADKISRFACRKARAHTRTCHAHRHARTYSRKRKQQRVALVRASG
jgi:hypothetical protein